MMTYGATFMPFYTPSPTKYLVNVTEDYTFF